MAITRITKGVIKPNENYDTHDINSTGIVTTTGLDVNGNADVSGSLSVGGVLTYEDVTSIDSVGIITAQKDIHVGAGLSVVGIVTAATFKGDGDFVDIDVDGHTNLDNVSVAGVTTFSDTVHVGTAVTVLGNGNAIFSGITTFNQGLNIPFYKSINIGANTHGKIHYPYGGSALEIQALNQIKLKSWDGNSYETAIHIAGVSGQVILGGYNMGNTRQPKLNVAGGTIQTITMDSSDGTNLTERFRLSQGGFNFTGLSTHTGNFDLDGDLDVDGHTNLDNVSVAGVSTFSNSIQVADSIIHQGDLDTKIDFATNQLKLTAANRLRIDLHSNHYNYLYGTQLIEADSTHPKPSGATYIARFRDTTGDNTEIQFFNTNVTNTVLAWNDYGNSTSAGNLVFKGNSGGSGLEHARFTGSGNFNLLRDLDVDGHTNLDNVSIAGLSTHSEGIFIPDDKSIRIGNTFASPDLLISSSSSSEQVVIDYARSGTGKHLRFRCTDLMFENYNGLTRIARFQGGVGVGHAELYYAGNKKFETTIKGIQVGTGVTVETNGQATFTGIVTASTYYGDGSNLSNITSTTINNNANNRLITGSGTANTLEGEANLTFDGSTLGIVGAATLGNGSGLNWGDTSARIRGESGASGLLRFDTNGSERVRIDSSGRLLVNTTSSSISSAELFEVKSTSSGFSHFRNNHSGYAPIYIDNEYTNTAMAPLITITDGGGNRAGLLLDPNSVFDISGQGAVSFSTGGTVGNATERVRIASDGKVGMGAQTNPQGQLDIRTTNDDDAIRLVNTATGDNGIQWWNEYGGLTKRVSMDYGEGDANFDIKLFRADAQDDRPYGNVRIFTGDYANPNMNFRVTTLGTVHQPNQPAFLVRDSVSGSAFGANSYADFDTVILNRGNHYNTSNGRFTAPIAGTYLFLSLMLSKGSNRLFHEIRKNGSRIEGTRTESGTTAGQYQSNTTQAIVELAKGDWVAIHVGSGGAYGSAFSNFSGYLLG